MPCSSTDGSAWNGFCYLKLLDPQPPKPSAVWNGRVDGAIYVCTAVPDGSSGIGVVGLQVWQAAPPAGLAPSPEQLARQALATVVTPQPTVNRSPSARNSDPAFGGQPYTWVNLWTWFWTSPDTWQPIVATAAAGGSSATVTVVPTALAFDPGDGHDAVECAGPGRAWQAADGDGAPTDGGCGYRYAQVTSGSTPLTATVTILWSVSWTGSGGTGGTFQDLHSDTRSSFIVEQIQTVDR